MPPQETEGLTIANIPSDIIRIIFRSEKERRNKDSIVSIRLISHQWDAIVRELSKDNKRIAISFRSFRSMEVKMSSRDLKHFGVENICDSSSSDVSTISRPIRKGFKMASCLGTVDDMDDTLRRILSRCSSISLMELVGFSYIWMPFLRKCLGSVIIRRVMSRYSTFNEIARHHGSAVKSIRVIRGLHIHEAFCTYSNPPYAFRAENIDLIRVHSVENISIINSSANVKALQDFITQASPLVQLLEIYEDASFPRNEFFENSKEFWKTFFKILNNSGKVKAHFYTEEDTAFNIFKSTYHSLMYVHATSPIETKRLCSSQFNCECFTNE